MHSATASCFWIQRRFKYCTKNGWRDFRPVESCTCLIDQQIHDFFCKARNLNVFICKQSTVDIRKCSKVVFHVRVTIFWLCVQYSKKFYDFFSYLFWLKLLEIISEHFMLSKNSCIFCIQTEHQPNAEHIQTFQCFLRLWILVLFQNRIVQLPHQIAGFERNLHLFFQMLTACIYKKL